MLQNVAKEEKERERGRKSCERREMRERKQKKWRMEECHPLVVGPPSWKCEEANMLSPASSNMIFCNETMQILIRKMRG